MKFKETIHIDITNENISEIFHISTLHNSAIRNGMTYADLINKLIEANNKLLIENTQLKEKLKEKAEGATTPTANEEG